jgi:hypothetical protein
LVNHDQTPQVVKVRPKTPEFEVFTVFSLYCGAPILALQINKNRSKKLRFWGYFTYRFTDQYYPADSQTVH